MAKSAKHSKKPEIGDLRDWLKATKALGELQIVKGADWNLEIGGISQINYRRRPNKAQLFDEIKGYPRGYRLLTASMGSTRRMAMTFRLPSGLSDQGLVKELRGKPLKWETESVKFPPHVVKSGAILEEVYRGADVNILKFPTPIWHEKDGGRYIGTGCAVITRDPDSDWVNSGAYRVMVLDEKRVTVNIESGKHGRLHLEKWWAREGRCPIAICLGMDPLLFAMAGLEIPTGIGEYNYAGAIMGRPVDVVRGPATGLPIPAGAEIVLEGWLYPDKQHKEGPYGEWTGYYSGGQRTAPLMEVETLLHRHDPILLGAPPGKPPCDYSYMRTVLKSSMIHDALVKAGVAEIRGVWAHECGGGRMLIVVSLKQRFCGHSRQAAAIAAQCQAASYMNRYVIVVDEDIDPTNLEEVMWAVCTRTDPATDIEVMKKTWGSKVDPMRREPGPTFNSRALIDACRPFDWINEFPAVAEASPEFVRKLLDKWGHLFAE
ncbi:MAG: UbiD family decarboxylase [Deltaproteobacteria bacterium]|nr:UbiD family decarboxylase [Deltaproteobacteria bacterium]